MKIRTKLLMILLLGAAIILGQGLCGLWQMQRLEGKLDAGLESRLVAAELEKTGAEAQVAFKTQVQEWKNILIRGNDKALYERYLKQFGEEEARVAKALAILDAGMQRVGLDAAPVRKADSELKALGEKYRSALQQFDPADPEAGKKVDVAVRGMDRTLAAAMAELDKVIATYALEQTEHFRAEAASIMHNAQWLTAAGVVLVLAGLAGVGWYLLQSIMRSVSGLRSTMLQVEQDWDLTHRAPVSGKDELAECGVALNQMLERFQQIVREIHTRMDELARQTASIASAVDQMGHSSNAQSSAASSVAAAVEELTVSVGQVGDAAQEAEQLAGRSRRSALNGHGAVEQGNAQLQRTSLRVHQTAAVLEELGTRSDAISGIVQTVKEIADQTNLLALNAAIEAARAGEQGRGFAVVADEVRKLAEKTTSSTAQINALVKLIQESSVQAIADVRSVVQAFEEQLGLASEAEQSIGEISQAADQTTEASMRINAALREQSSASQLIAQQVEQIASMCEESNGAAQSVDHNARSLDQLAVALVETVRRFRV
ncbi:hypothetical protein C0V76_07915 [Uliginosibacterium sp. TH139]|nr:hypothetical protein C0V76_07915 [Uliginosibacterium sp. TH139]